MRSNGARRSSARTVAYVRGIELRLNGGTLGQGILATVLAIAPPVVLAGLLWWLADRIHPALGFLVNVAVLYLLMGFRHFSHSVSAIVAALKSGDLASARRSLAAWRGAAAPELSSQDIARLAIERGLADAYRQVFAVVFWFMVLPGPVGAILYRATALLAAEWKGALPGDDMTVLTRSLLVFGRPARRLLWLIDWIPVRLTALSFAVVGDFEDAAYCWRTQARYWPEAHGGETVGIVLASGGGALGVQLGGLLPDADGDVDPRPGHRNRRRGRSGNPSIGGRSRMAGARPVAVARVPAVARQLGTVARRRGPIPRPLKAPRSTRVYRHDAVHGFRSNGTMCRSIQ